MANWKNNKCGNCGKATSSPKLKCTNCNTVGCPACVGNKGKGLCKACKKTAEKVYA